MVAYRLVDMMGRASAANILGITVRELDKFVEVLRCPERFTALRDPSAAITLARELIGDGSAIPEMIQPFVHLDVPATQLCFAQVTLEPV
jgi:hypothetical protein